MRDEMIERAICAYASLQKTMAEGAGAAGLAAMLSQPETFAGRKVGLYLTGGNIDPRVLASVIVRGLGRESKIVSLRITINDQPGMLGRIAGLLGEERANILEVSHRRMFLDVPSQGSDARPHGGDQGSRARAPGDDAAGGRGFPGACAGKPGRPRDHRRMSRGRPPLA